MSEPGTSDIEALRVTREESRFVLDHQIALQREIDEKALRTVRLSLVLIALIVSVAQLREPRQLASLEIGTLLSVGVGVLGLSMAVFIGLGVYVETKIPFGVGPGHRREVTTQAYSDSEWLDVLLEEYDRWTAEASVANGSNALWLSRAQASMAIGVGYLFVSVLVLITPISAGEAFLGSSIVGGITILLYYVRARERA